MFLSRLVSFGALVLLASCFMSGSRWAVDHAEELRADGRLEDALYLTEREIERHYRHLPPHLADLHVAILREMGRDAEATAFQRFVERYDTGADTFGAEGGASRKDCKSSEQPEMRLISSWGGLPRHSIPYPSEQIAATFEVDADGRISKIDVFEARHPGAAWLIIRWIGGATIAPDRLAEQRAEDMGAFPIGLCFCFGENLPGEGHMAPGFTIRGSGL